MVNSGELRWSIPGAVLFGALTAFAWTHALTWLLWFGVTGLLTSLVYVWMVMSAPRYCAFMILGTSRERFLWRSDTWDLVVPKVDSVLTAIQEEASIIWFPGERNRSKEKIWKTKSSREWTYPATEPLTSPDITEFFQTYLYAPPRRKVFKGGRGTPKLYLRIGNHHARVGTEWKSKVTQYSVLLVRRSLFMKHEASILELVHALEEVTEASAVGYCEPRMGDLGDFESHELSPIYRDEHLAEFPDFARMALPWRAATTTPSSTSGPATNPAGL